MDERTTPKEPTATTTPRVRVGIALIVASALLVVMAGILLLIPRITRDYGFPDDVADQYRIVELVPERWSQPALASLSEVRDHLERSGVACDGYEEFRQEPSPEGGDFSGETHVWAECDGGAMVLYRYSHHGSKVSHIDDRASCMPLGASGDVVVGIAPFKPQYWIEGPTWSVALARSIKADDAMTEATARSMARHTGARLYRSCAPSPEHPAGPVKVVPVGRTATLEDFGSPVRVTVTGIERTPSATPGYDRLTVRMLRDPAEDAYIEVAAHRTGSESYYLGGDVPDGDAPVIVRIPSDLTDVSLRISTAQWDEIGDRYLIDVPLR